jgi:hypothetical protein
MDTTHAASGNISGQVAKGRLVVMRAPIELGQPFEAAKVRGVESPLALWKACTAASN